MNAGTLVLPIIQWAQAAPLIIIFAAAVLATLFEAFLPRAARRPVQIIFSLLALAATLVAVVWRWGVASEKGSVALSVLAGVPTDQSGQSFSLVEDSISLLGQGVILICAILAILVIADRTAIRDGAFVASAATRPASSEEKEATDAGWEHTEIFPLALFCVGGMMVFTSAFDLLTLFIGLEVISLPLYVLTALARHRRLLSQEAAMKYFLMGAFSSAIFLMGAALLYGTTGSISMLSIGAMQMLYPAQTVFGAVGCVMVAIGLLFKVGAVPFHAWTPDVYQGAPTPITGFMAAGTKAAAFIALARLFMSALSPQAHAMNVFMWIVIVATILVGTVLGIVQKDVKRMLAYSAIAHAGFILVAINAFRNPPMAIESYADYVQPLSAIIFYLLSYGVASVGAFGIVALVRRSTPEIGVSAEATDLDSWRGLGKKSPLTAVAMAIFLLSFAGIPFTGGFIGKFEVFRAGVSAGELPLVVLAVIASAATAFFYFRLIQLMFFTDESSERSVVVESEGMASVSIMVAALLTLVLGIIPGPVIEFIQHSIA